MRSTDLNYSAFQFLQRIKRPAPGNPTGPQSNNRRTRLHPNENQRADGERQRDQWRNCEFQTRAYMQNDREPNANACEQQRPAVREKERYPGDHAHHQ